MRTNTQQPASKRVQEELKKCRREDLPNPPEKVGFPIRAAGYHPTYVAEILSSRNAPLKRESAHAIPKKDAEFCAAGLTTDLGLLAPYRPPL